MRGEHIAPGVLNNFSRRRGSISKPAELNPEKDCSYTQNYGIVQFALLRQFSLAGRFHAFTIAHYTDRNSSGRRVRQFKTSLLQRLEQVVTLIEASLCYKSGKFLLGWFHRFFFSYVLLELICGQLALFLFSLVLYSPDNINTYSQQ